MQVRGAPLIGATAAYGCALALRQDASDEALDKAAARLERDPADRDQSALGAGPRCVPRCATGRAASGVAAAYAEAGAIADDDVATCRAIGEHGPAADRARSPPSKPARPVNVLTHCNAGWLATVDWGTALAPIYHGP